MRRKNDRFRAYSVRVRFESTESGERVYIFPEQVGLPGELDVEAASSTSSNSASSRLRLDAFFCTESGSGGASTVDGSSQF